MQSANNWYQGVLSGTNQGPANAAVQSIDLNYQEQLRNLQAQYRSLRPGTDFTSDSTYQRDVANLNTMYQQQRSNALAGVQGMAAQGAAGVGGQQMAGMQSGIEAQLDQIATQWGMSQSQRSALRDALTGMGGQMAMGPMQNQNLMAMMKMFGGK